MLSELWTWLENLPLAQYIGESYWFPLLESIHVIGVVFVVGAILVMDLRLLGLTARRYSVTDISDDLLPWSWFGFVVAVITGAGLFITRANHYAENPAFQVKALLLLLAGINMIIFHFGIFRRVREWNSDKKMPTAARMAGAVSILLWSGVVLSGRWVGHLS